jgi:hypothetical protein
MLLLSNLELDENQNRMWCKKKIDNTKYVDIVLQRLVA